MIFLPDKNDEKITLESRRVYCAEPIVYYVKMELPALPVLCCAEAWETSLMIKESTFVSGLNQRILTKQLSTT